MLLSIDDYYDVQFYNECVEALKNNGVSFNEFISTVSPYHFYFDVENPPTFINYDKASRSYEQFLVSIIKPLTPKDEYIYMRRDAFANDKGIKQYAINDALSTGQESGEGIFFTAEKDEILRISKDYQRKIFFMGRYFNRRYKVFFTDNLIIKNFINPDQVLAEGRSFKLITELEAKLNYKVFHLKDRLIKLSETPFVFKGNFYPVSNITPELKAKYTLS